MIGINASNGQSLSGVAHLQQSIIDILKTPVGSRLMLPTYGSRIFELMDAPITPAWIADFYAAVAQALDQWEPRFRLISTELVSVKKGHITFDLYGTYLPDGKTITVEGLVI